VVRGLSNVVLDDPAGLRRVTLGDAVTFSTGLGGSSLLAGISVTREFALDPYFVRQPLPRLAGAILTPSTLDLYVNGVLVRQEQLAPGPFEVRNLPVTTGAGQVSYVVRDAFGRTQEYASPYYASSGMLADGVSEYGYHLGLRRLGFGQDSFHYGPPELSARHRIGIGNRLTAGYRFESGLQHIKGWDEPSCASCGSLLASGGPTLTATLPVGQVDLDAAASADGGAAGAAASVGWSLFARSFALGAVARAMTPSYAHLGQPAGADRPLLQVLGTVGAPVTHRLSLTLEGQLNSMRDAGLTSNLGMRADLRISNNLSLAFGGSRFRSPAQVPQWSGFATLLYNFGGGTTADLGGSGGTKGAGASGGVQKSLPLGEGWAWQLRSSVEQEQPTVGIGQLQYQGAYGTLLGSYVRTGRADGASATAAGALVLLDGNLLASRPVQEGFALLQVPGVPGVRGYLNNQEIGRTDAKGNLLVPSLQPYYGNRLSIGDADVPIDYQVGKTEQVVATPLRGGALVRFDVERVQSVTGLVRVDALGRSEVPAYGEITAAGQRSPVGGRGQFLFENLTAGRHAAQVEYQQGVCRFELEVPQSAGSNVDLGTVACTRLEKVAALP
jgi:outer membrane usher protein